MNRYNVCTRNTLLVLEYDTYPNYTGVVIIMIQTNVVKPILSCHTIRLLDRFYKSELGLTDQTRCGRISHKLALTPIAAMPRACRRPCAAKQLMFATWR